MAERGEMWLVDFGEPVGREQGYRRPALVVSANQLHRSRAELVIVVPVATTRRGLPSHVEIEPGDSGLDDISYAKVEDVKSVSTRRLIHRLGVVSADRLHHAEHVLRLLLDL